MKSPSAHLTLAARMGAQRDRKDHSRSVGTRGSVNTKALATCRTVPVTRGPVFSLGGTEATLTLRSALYLHEAAKESLYCRMGAGCSVSSSEGCVAASMGEGHATLGELRCS